MEIKNRTTGKIIFSGDYLSIRECVEDAVRKKIKLQRAGLQGVDLRGANLYGADFRGADLYGADLCDADLQWADLHGVDLRWANLHGTDLYAANLYRGVGAVQWQSPLGLKRMCYSVAHGEKVMHKIGCFWGDTEEAASAIIKKYGDNSLYEKIMRLNTEVLQ